jgi:biopolymer transport protein ExbB/TolQ
MSTAWRWILGIVLGLLVVGLVVYGRSDRQAYRIARGAVEQRVELAQDRIDAAAEMAIASVDLALQLAGDLPSQQAQADLVKQDIEEISNRLKEAAELRGEEAIERLNQSVEQFNQTLETVEDASQAATDPAAKSLLDRIYGTLEATKEQLVQVILGTQE